MTLTVEERAIEDIRPYEGNPRRNADAVGAVAKSIQEFGWRVPIVLDRDGVVICGHTRLLAARQLGMTHVPVHVAKNLTPEQARAYRLADNATHDLSSWDGELLPLELKALEAVDFDMSLLGFSDSELSRLMNDGPNPGLVDPDSIPEPPEEPISKRGDLWRLGSHRLLCGDSAVQADVDRLINGAKIHLCNSDPPYGVRVEPRSNNAIAAGNSSFSAPNKKKVGSGKSGGRTHHQSFDVARQGEKKATTKQMRAKDRPLENDFVSDEEFIRLLQAWFGQIARVLVPGRAFFIWGGYANIGNYPPVLKECGLYFSQAIIWHKMHPVLTRKDFMGDHEWCFYGWREGAAHQFYGPNNVPDVWPIKKINPNAMQHLTEKPVELASRAISYSSQPGENVLDLFGGSGSTLIAAEQTGRRCFTMELDPAYTDLIVARYEQFSGKKAERQKA